MPSEEGAGQLTTQAGLTHEPSERHDEEGRGSEGDRGDWYGDVVCRKQSSICM